MTTHARDLKMDWDDPGWEPPMTHSRLRRVLSVLLSLLLAGGIVMGSRWLYHRNTPHPGATPTMVSQCRPPGAWDHFEVSSARSMGPPVRQ